MAGEERSTGRPPRAAQPRSTAPFPLPAMADKEGRPRGAASAARPSSLSAPRGVRPHSPPPPPPSAGAVRSAGGGGSGRGRCEGRAALRGRGAPGSVLPCPGAGSSGSPSGPARPGPGRRDWGGALGSAGGSEGRQEAAESAPAAGYWGTAAPEPLR